MYYIGLDLHKKTISYCIKDISGKVLAEGTIEATRQGLDEWMKQLPGPWMAGMEATIFTGWVYDHLRPHGVAVKVAHPLMLRAIAAAKKKNDRVDAATIADCLRCNFLPECYMAPMEIRDRRRTLRYRNLLVRQAVQLKNKTAGLLMETGVTYNKKKLHQGGYFTEFLATNEEISESLRPLLRLNRGMLLGLEKVERGLLRSLEQDPRLVERVRRLMTIPGIGPVTALSWVLEVGEAKRFSSVKQVISYCGLCADEKSSAGVAKRGPLSKQRNKHLQTVLVEAAKLAPRWSPELALVYDNVLEKGNRNRATLAVARKLAAYLLAVDRGERAFEIRSQEVTAA
jgi:transposase